MSCPRHPHSFFGVGPTNKGQCWHCLGCPPDWTCNTCQKKLPCEHMHESVVDRALIKIEAEARVAVDTVFATDRKSVV